MEYTVEIYKEDRRYQKGERLIQKVNVKTEASKDELKLEYGRAIKKKGYRVEVHETYVTRRNAMTGVEFKERYDTPYYCSPSSETYWSM